MSKTSGETHGPPPNGFAQIPTSMPPVAASFFFRRASSWYCQRAPTGGVQHSPAAVSHGTGLRARAGRGRQRAQRRPRERARRGRLRSARPDPRRRRFALARPTSRAAERAGPGSRAAPRPPSAGSAGSCCPRATSPRRAPRAPARTAATWRRPPPNRRARSRRSEVRAREGELEGLLDERDDQAAPGQEDHQIDQRQDRHRAPLVRRRPSGARPPILKRTRPAGKGALLAGHRARPVAPPGPSGRRFARRSGLGIRSAGPETDAVPHRSPT